LGRGIATAALSAFLSLEHTGPLYAGVAKRNAASIRLLEKCGFKISSVEEASNDAAGFPHPFDANSLILACRRSAHQRREYMSTAVPACGSQLYLWPTRLRCNPISAFHLTA
jgi:hypothetical protein